MDTVDIIDSLVPTMEGVRNRRLFIETEWLDNYRTWRGWPSLKYMVPLADNAIHYFIPFARKAIERSVKRGTQLLLPHLDRIQTLANDINSHPNAEAVHNTLHYILNKKVPVHRNISSGLRCLQLYNFTATCTSAIIQKDEVWPFQRVVDPFNFYIYPETAATTEEATLIFEDCILPYQVYASFVDTTDVSKSLYKQLDISRLQKPTWPYHVIERLAYRGLTNPDDVGSYTAGTFTLTESAVQNRRETVVRQLGEQNKHFVTLSKVYFRVASYWYYTVICRNIVGGSESHHNADIVRLDNVENQPLYRWTTTRPVPGEIYLPAPTDDIRVLQNLANNAISQAESCRATYAEPPVLFSAHATPRTETKVFGNRRIWVVEGDPRDSFVPFPVQDTGDISIRAWQLYKNLIDSNAGGEMAEGNPGRNMPRSGDMVGTLLDMSLIDIKDDTAAYESDILTPGLGDIYHILLEYVPDSQIIKIPNKNPSLIKAYKKRDITGDYSFTWLGSLAFQGIQERADKFASFFATLTNPQALAIVSQQLNSSGLKIDFANILRTWYSYALGEKGLGDIITEMSEQEIVQYKQALQQQQQQQQQQSQQVQQRAQSQLQGTQIKAQSAQQRNQVDLAKAQLELQGKELDLKGKLLDFNIKRVESLRNSNGDNNGL